MCEEAIAKLQPIILLSGSNEEKLATLKEVLAASETGLKGVYSFLLGQGCGQGWAVLVVSSALQP